MTNPIIQTDLADVLKKMDSRLERMEGRLNNLEVGQIEIKEKLSGQITSLDERLSGQITSLDNKFSGKIVSLDEKFSGQIASLDNKLSGQITNLDEKLSGKIDVIDQKIVAQKEINSNTCDQLEKRIANQEFSNRIVLGGMTYPL